MARVSKTNIFQSPFISWTKASNNTLIVAEKDELDEHFLIRALAHELALSFDAKSNIDESFFHLEAKSPSQNICKTLAAINYPLVKASLSALRALSIEANVLGELGLRDKENLVSIVGPGLTCRSKVEKMAEVLKGNLRIFTKQDFYYNDLLRPFCRFLPNTELLPDNEQGLKTALDLITQANLNDSEGRALDLCKYLVSPEIDNKNIMFSSGPKPRIIGGW